MAKLGEAYVSIRADLTKFDKDLDLALKRAVDKFERDLNRQLGKRLGTNLGGGVREGVRESMNGIGKELGDSLDIPANSSGRRAARNFKRGAADELQDNNIIVKALAVLVSGLEDGFSALPAKVKAAVGGALVAALIPAGALAGAALGTALIAGVTAAGVALAFQFNEVSDRGEAFAANLRYRLVSSAESFGNATINAMDLFDERLMQIGPTLRSVFDNASKFVVPFAESTANLIEGIFEGIDRGLKNAEIENLTAGLVDGFDDIGVAIGDAFATLLSNPNLDLALNDLLDVVEELITVGGEFLNWTLDVYDDFKVAVEIVEDFVDSLYSLYQAVNALVTAQPGAGGHFLDFLGLGDDVKLHKEIDLASNATSRFNSSLQMTIKSTKEEQKALEELQRALELQTRNAHDAVSAQIAYEDAIDRSNAALKASKGSIDLTNAAGREAADQILRRIELLDKFTQLQLEKGKLTEEQAQKYYQNEIARLRAEFVARGGSIKQFNDLYAEYIKLAGLPPIADPTGPLNLGAKNLKQSFDLARLAWEKALASFKKRPANGNIKVQGGTQLAGFADGGFITEPQIIAAGEGGRPELILPLTQPNRSLQLLAQSPLANVIGGGPSIVYAIFDGEPFQARIVKTVNNSNRANARTISQVPRNI
jgi:hypothetical protein